MEDKVLLRSILKTQDTK